MRMRKVFYFTLLIICFFSPPCLALETWNFKLTYETSQLINSPFFLMTAADLNKNGTKELVVTDFGRFGNHIEEWKQWKQGAAPALFNLFVLEWDKKELKTRWSKQWDMSKTHSDMEAGRYFLAFEANQMVSWEIGDRIVVETTPPYLGLEWVNGKYVLHEQQGPFNAGPPVGSWVFPWLSASCSPSFSDVHTWSRECLVGIRDFSGKGDPKIVTIVEDEIIKNKRYKQSLRVRKCVAGFPIEWEISLDYKYHFGSPLYIDRLNLKATDLLLLDALLLSDKRSYSSFIFEYDPKEGYKLRPLKKSSTTKIAKNLPSGGGLSLYDYPDIYLATYDLPDIYLRTTQKQGKEEFWGYRRKDLNDPKSVNFILLLRKVTLKPDLKGFTKEDIDFPHHKSFLGVGYFDVKDIDGDGLDEIILVEETAGKLSFGEETVYFSDVKDYIHILKWDGTLYKTMWVSPPYTKRGTKFLIEDIKNTGKKQLVVMTSNGTIQIWERQ